MTNKGSSERKVRRCGLNFLVTKKGVVYRAAMLAWAANEHLQRMCILFDNDVVKLYRLPSFEQTHHLSCSVRTDAAHPVHMSLYQELVFINTERRLVILDLVRQETMATIHFSPEIQSKFLRSETCVLPLLFDAKVHFLIASSAGTVLMAHLAAGSAWLTRLDLRCHS